MDHFVHLHVHSDASDGAGTPETLAKRAEELHFKALALTDHGTVANIVSFADACKAHGIKPIFGQEIYFAMPVGDKTNIYHMTVLAQNKAGLSNLFKLTTIGAKSVFKKPAIMLSDLIAHSEGLILLSGCQSSPIYDLPWTAACSFISSLMPYFKDRLFMEVMFVSSVDTHTIPMRLAEKFSVPAVLTTDVHFARQEDAPVHKLITSARFGYSYDSSLLWLKSLNQMKDVSKELGLLSDTLVYQSGIIADMCEDIDLGHEPSLPKITGAYAYIRGLASMALKEAAKTTKPSEMRERILRAHDELEVIENLGYTSYFYIVNDIVEWARAHDCVVGPGRGSGAGSYLLYLLGITKVDPFEFNLSFARFLNSKRKDMPDVDIDFEMDKRDEVIQYAEKKWNGVPIATYAHYGHKVLVHDLARLLGISREEDTAASESDDSPEFVALRSKYPLFAQAYDLVLGQIRHRGKHASGIIITDREVPLERAGNALVVPWSEGNYGKELSHVGVVKFDLLGLSALSSIKRMQKLSGRLAGKFGSDDLVIRSFRRGDILGIFQFSGSAGIKKLTLKVQPTTGMDLVAINSLYRPGALDVGSTEAYPEWKKHPRIIEPRVDAILAETFGAIVYQEQVMSLFALITGGSLEDADMIRRVIFKAKTGDWEMKVDEIHKRFLSSGADNGFSTKVLETLWTEIISHARYSFNKSHAVCYTHISYAMAWHKVYTPLAFYAAQMSYDNEHLSEYMYEVVQKGFEIIPPKINLSSCAYEIEGNAISLPLSVVRFLGDKGVDEIIRIRTAGGDFLSKADFAKRVGKRVVSQRARASLYALGAFAGLNGGPEDLGLTKESIEQIATFKTERDRQRKYMGMSIPNARILAGIDHLRSEMDHSREVGIVSAVVERHKPKGTIWSIYLQPSGFAWTVEKPDLVPGDAVIIKKRGMKAHEIKRF